MSSSAVSSNLGQADAQLIGVDERAAARCDQAVWEIDDLMARAQQLTRRRKFGANADGEAAAARFAQAGQDYIDTMNNAQRVFADMAAACRAAGCTVTETDTAALRIGSGLPAQRGETVDVVADLLGFAGPTGHSGGSSNWAGWGHAEIRWMLDTSVDPDDVGDVATAWRDQAHATQQVLAGAARDLEGIVSQGWCGASADAASAAIGQIHDWSSSVSATVDHITRLMDASGAAVGRAKDTVPLVTPHDWERSLRSFALAGAAGAFVDAVARERAQSQAHAEAVRIMNNVYSAPINHHCAALPTYPQLHPSELGTDPPGHDE